MYKNFTKMIFGLVLIFFFFNASAQTTITGTITDENNEALLGVNVLVEGTVLGTITDVRGDFSLNVQSAPPFTLVISYVGFETQRIEVSSGSSLNIQLVESALLGQEVVVSASRVEESILGSPVSIEKMNILDVQQAPAQDFYGSLVNYKNVDMTTQSFTFRSLSLRGFASNGNVRMVQLIDGVDNQAPGLNFPVGNIAGISDLDLESVELLPGASSALYGPNAINGIVIMNSKSPFDYQGLSATFKGGVNHVGEADTDISPFTDVSLRYAKAINDKFAFKVTGQFLDAEDWYATDTRDVNANLDPSSTRENNPNYNGVNTLGDEVSADIGGGILVSRTGFNEQDLVDYTARSQKISGALHYKFNSKLEGILQANVGSGQNVYTGIDRYSIVDFTLATYKAELRGDNFNLRAYTTRENSGDSYAAGLAAIWMNEEFAPSTITDENGNLVGGWFLDYGAAFGGFLNDFGIPGGDPAAAREYADRDIPEPGSPEFEAALDRQKNAPITTSNGARFLDKTKLYSYEGSYNFKNQIDWADIIIGANYRTYALESEGTLFALDENGNERSIDEYGGFVQASKRLLRDAVKLTGSLRYDKNENFDGRTTPRIAGVWTFLEGQNIRASYQTAFRMPTTQDQYIDLGTPQGILLGGLLAEDPATVEKYGFDTDPMIRVDENGDPILDENGGLILYSSDLFEFDLEQNISYEIGYRGIFNNKFLVDAYYYNSVFTNFSGTSIAAQIGSGNGFLIDRTLTGLDVESQGAVIGLNYAAAGGYEISGNYAWNELSNRDDILEEDPNFLTGFNTPEHKVNLSVGNRKLTDRIGFNVAWRWQDAFLWESTFAQGEVDAFSTVDFQISYAIPNLKSRIKVGGSNIFNERYTQAVGNPTVGALWYASITFDEFFRN